MYEELLTEIGLTKSEIAVYFALLELGSSTTGPIIKKAEICQGNILLFLSKSPLHCIEDGNPSNTYIISHLLFPVNTMNRPYLSISGVLLE